MEVFEESNAISPGGYCLLNRGSMGKNLFVVAGIKTGIFKLFLTGDP